MRWRYKILMSIVVLLIGYTMGVLLPPHFISQSQISDAPISRGDYYLILVGVLTAFGTLSAAAVALFMNEIRSTFKKVVYDINLDYEEIKEEVIEIKGNKKAKRYFNSCLFANTGNINALNCELYIESASFKANEITSLLTWENAPIKWSEEHSMSYIPSKGKRMLPLFEITAPERQSTPDGKTTITPGQIKIAGLKPCEAKGGCWEMIYCIYSSTAKPQKFKLIVDWNGKWEDRQTEMKNMLHLTLTMI